MRRRNDALGCRRVLAAAAACLALSAAAVVSLAGCTPASGAAATGGSSSLTDGIGPITFAIGSDDISWLTPVLNAWNASHPGQRVTPLYLPEAANDQLAQLVANLQAKSDAYDVIDLDVVWTAEFASAGWIIPLPASKFPLQDFLRAGRRHRHVPGPAVRGPRLQQRRPALLPLRHPRQGAPEAAHDLGAAAVAGDQGGPQVPPRRVRGHARAL